MKGPGRRVTAWSIGKEATQPLLLLSLEQETGQVGAARRGCEAWQPFSCWCQVGLMQEREGDRPSSLSSGAVCRLAKGTFEVKGHYREVDQCKWVS